MNAVVILLVGIVILVLGYIFYGGSGKAVGS